MAFALVFAPSAAGAAPGPEGAAPRYRFKEGEKLAFVAEATTRIDISASGRTSASQMTQLIDITWQMGKVDGDGRAAVTQTIDRIRFKAVTPRETVEYDTRDGKAPDDPRAKVFANMLNALVGGRLSMTIDPRGQFTDFKVLARVGAGGDGDPSCEAGFRHLMGQLIPVLPEEGPAEGQSWAVKTAGKIHDARVTGENRYTYAGQEERAGKKVDKLSLTAAVKLETDPGAAAEVAVRVSDGGGAAYLDRAAGRLVESSLRRAMEFEAGDGDAKITRKVTEAITLKLADGGS